MPIYEYDCPTCGEFEMFQGIKEDNLETCPDCNSPVKKLMSHNSFHLKGGGWYSDGYSKNRASGSRVPSKGLTTKHPIIKDRNTGKTLSGPDTSTMKKS